MRAKKQILLTRKNLYGIMLLAVFLSAFGNGNLTSARAQTWTSTHQITYFQGNKAGAVSITFDDGYPSQVNNGVSQLNARGLKGTFFIITKWVGISWQPWPNWATWQDVAAQGHEIASHTVTHPSLPALSEDQIRWELSTSQSLINQNIPGQNCISLAYPSSDVNDTIEAITADYYVAGRGGWTGEGSVLNHYQPGQDQYGSYNTVDFYNVGSMSGDGLTISNENFNDRLDRAVLSHAWLDIHFHEINDSTAFGTILDYIQGKQAYWIDTFGNISRYMKERLNSTIQVITDTPSEIRINILMDASLPTSIYNVPLTIRSTVPASWAQVIVQQGSAIQTLTPVMEGSEKVVYYNALPNGGDISLTATDTPTATFTATNVPAITPTPTPTFTPTYAPTNTATDIPTATFTATNVPIPTITPTPTPTFTPTHSPTNTPTATFTATNVPTITPTPTRTPTVTPTYIATNTSTNAPTNTITPTATRTNTPTKPPTNTAPPTNTLPPPTATNTPLPGPANTGFLNPSANAAQTGGDGNGYQTNSINAYTNNSVFAVDTNSGTNSNSSCTDSGKDKHRFYNYGFSIPGTTVLGIEVRLDAKVDSMSGAPKLCIQLSWNAGTSWTTAKQTGTLTTTEQTYTLGSPSDNWGHTWILSQLSNSNFRVRIIDVATNTSRDFSLDWITVRVTYQ